MQSSARRFQLTINNPIEKNLDHQNIKEKLETIKPIVYWCMSDEIGEQGTPHTHLYIACSSVVRFTTLKKQFPEAHIEAANGSSGENRAYVQKSGKWADDVKSETSVEGSFEEWGTLPIERQGARTDLEMLYEMVKDGKSNYEIIEAYPDFLTRLTDIERVRQTIRAEEFRTTFRNMSVTYIWGPTGTGKTRSVMEAHGYDAVYRVTEYEHPFDGYGGQDTLLLDEFRSQLKISEMLNLLDGFPLELRCRYANKVACFDTVYIISNIDLCDQYPTIQIEQRATWRAFLRRVHKVVKFFSDGHTREYTTREYFHGFVEVENVDGPFGP